MKAAVLYGKEEIRVEKIEPKALQLGEVRVHIEAALTCGTDLKVFKRGYHARMIVPPAVFSAGLEFSGVISEVHPGNPGMENRRAHRRRQLRALWDLFLLPPRAGESL